MAHDLLWDSSLSSTEAENLEKLTLSSAMDDSINKFADKNARSVYSI